MKVLYIGNFSLPDHDAAAVRVMGNALALRECNIETVFLDAQPSKVWKREMHHNNTFRTISRRINDKKIFDYVHCMFNISQVINTVEQEGDVKVIIAYNYSSIALNRIRRYCKRKGIICISDCTEWYSAKNYMFPLSIFSAIDTMYRMRFVNKKVDGIITVSSYLEEFYNKQNTHIVPFYIDCDSLNRVTPDIVINDSCLRILYGGSPGKNKEKVQEIIHGIKESEQYNDIILRITGLTKENYIEMYPDDQWIVNDDHFRFFGRVSRGKNLAMLKASDFLIFYRESNRQNMAGFPTKFVEAVGLGVPVVTTDTSDLKVCSIANSIPTTFIENKEDITHFFSQEYDVLKEYKAKAQSCTKVFDYKDKSAAFGEWLRRLVKEK